jgi:putative tricarboxylic transport membrane protein
MVLEGLFDLLGSAAIIYMVLGLILGIIFGAMPGFGATLGIVLLIPFTFGMDPTTALPMLAGVYSGAIYGGSITAVLIGIPGTSSSAPTVLDGYEMTKKGESRKALTTAVISSSVGAFIGGTTLLIFATTLSQFTLLFGPAEYFMIAVFGLTIIAALVGDSIVIGIISGLIGLFLATIGLDSISGADRFTFGQVYLIEGLPLIPVILALFAFPRSLEMIGEVLRNKSNNVSKKEINLKGKAISFKEMSKMWRLLLRSSFLGTFVGMIPGAGANIACWIAYSEAKRISKHPEKFGTGTLEGIVAAEAANSATEGGSLIPMLTLSVPGSSAAAVMFGALLIHGLVPGPLLFTNEGPVAYSYIWAIIFNSGLLLAIGLYGSRFFMKIADVQKAILAPIIMIVTFLGAYATRQLYFDIYVTIILGTIFYFLSTAKFSMPAILLGFILGPIAEKGFRRAMLIHHDDWTIFFTRPICIIIIILIVISLYASLRIIKKTKINSNFQKK